MEIKKIKVSTKIFSLNIVQPRILLFAGLALFILNPYTSLGPLGFYATVPFLFLAMRSIALSVMIRKHGLTIWVLITISTYAVWNSAVNNIFQITHLYMTISLCLVIFSSVGVWKYCHKNKIVFEEFLLILLLVILSNSIIIFLELMFPEFRTFIEQFLAQSDNNYRTTHRFRGIASAGGAALSVLAALGVGITLQLYIKKYLSILMVALSLSILLFSSLLIGRTGTVLSVIPIVFFLIWMLRTNVSKVFIFIAFLSGGCYFLYPLAVLFFQEKFSAAFVYYAIGFFFASDGLSNEGTVGAMATHFHALPTEWPYLITGHGYYGVSDFTPRTDSGFGRMFLAIGYLLGTLYYLLFFKIMSVFSNKDNLFILISGFSILFIAEIKEPLLLSMYSSRLLVMVAIFSYLNSRAILLFDKSLKTRV